jgi:hypothetical protein
MRSRERRFERFKRFIALGLVESEAAVIYETTLVDLLDHEDYRPGFPPGRRGVTALTAALI